MSLPRLGNLSTGSGRKSPLSVAARMAMASPVNQTSTPGFWREACNLASPSAELFSMTGTISMPVSSLKAGASGLSTRSQVEPKVITLTCFCCAYAPPQAASVAATAARPRQDSLDSVIMIIPICSMCRRFACSHSGVEDDAAGSHRPDGTPVLSNEREIGVHARRDRPLAIGELEDAGDVAGNESQSLRPVEIAFCRQPEQIAE